MTRLLLAFVFSLALSSAACRRSPPETQWSANQVSNEYVRITPGEISVSRDRLYVKTTLFNTSDKVLTVERDAIRLKLPDGRTARRSTGITSTHKPYTVQPGASQSVYVDFLPAEDFDWSKVPSAELDFSEAVHAGAANVPVPSLVLTREDLAAGQAK